MLNKEKLMNLADIEKKFNTFASEMRELFQFGGSGKNENFDPVTVRKRLIRIFDEIICINFNKDIREQSFTINAHGKLVTLILTNNIVQPSPTDKNYVRYEQAMTMHLGDSYHEPQRDCCLFYFANTSNIYSLQLDNDPYMKELYKDELLEKYVSHVIPPREMHSILDYLESIFL